MHKLVRDYIPEIMVNRSFPACKFRKASDKEFFTLLIAKLHEEIDELVQEKNIEELADVFEVLDTIRKHLGFPKNRVEQVRKRKKLDRGGFKKRYILEKD